MTILTYFTVIVTGKGRRQCVQVVTIPHLVAWPIASPELNRVIVGAGAQYMAEWMPAETPHDTVVGRIDRTDLLIRAGRIESESIIIKDRSLYLPSRALTQHSRREWTHLNRPSRTVPREWDATKRHWPPSCAPGTLAPLG